MCIHFASVHTQIPFYKVRIRMFEANGGVCLTLTLEVTLCAQLTTIISARTLFVRMQNISVLLAFAPSPIIIHKHTGGVHSATYAMRTYCMRVCMHTCTRNCTKTHAHRQPNIHSYTNAYDFVLCGCLFFVRSRCAC